MYLEFFKFSRKPFNSDTDADFFYQTASTRKVYDQIVNVIQQQARCVRLTGKAGVGKTTFLKSLMADAGLMINWILIDLATEISSHDDDSECLFDIIKRKTIGFDSTADFRAIIIDGANHLDKTVLQKLFKLQILNQGNGDGFTIILAGNPEVVTTLVDTDKGNVAAHPKCYDFNLKAFTHQEICAAIGYRLKIAEYQGPELFKSDALELVYQLSGGIPGVAFHICDLALFLTGYHRLPEVTLELVQKASKFIFLDKDVINGKELSPKPPLVGPSRTGSVLTKFFGEVASWKGAVAGLLFLFGAGAWIILRPTPTHKPQKVWSTLTSQSQAKDSQEHTEQTAALPESSQQVTGSKFPPLSTAKPNRLVVGPELNSSQETVEVQPEQPLTELLLFENLPPPSAGFSKSTVTGDNVVEPYKAYPIVSEIPGAKETIIDVQPYTAGNDQVLQGPDSENNMPTLLDDEKETLSGPEHRAMEVSVTQKNATNYNKMNSTELSHPPIPQISANTVAKTPPAIAQDLTKQPTPVRKEKELQTGPEVSIQARPKVVEALPQSQKSDSSSKIQLASIPPEQPRTLSTIQSTGASGRALDLHNGVNLVNAAGYGHLQDVLKLLEDGVEVNSVNDARETALMRAAWIGQTDILTLLLRYNPQVNQKGPEGWTALFYGAIKGHEVIVAKLLAHGARPDVADFDGQTPLMAATWNGHTKIASLLLDSNVDPNRKNRDGWSSLMFAAIKGDTDVARTLLLHGADPSIKNNEGNTCTQIAAQQGHEQFVSLMSSLSALR